MTWTVLLKYVEAWLLLYGTWKRPNVSRPKLWFRYTISFWAMDEDDWRNPTSLDVRLCNQYHYYHKAILQPKSHYFQIIEWSPWPYWLSCSLYALVLLNFVSFNILGCPYISKKVFLFLFSIVVYSLISAFFFWIENILEDYKYYNICSAAVERNALIGILLFIASETMLFFAFFWVFFFNSLEYSVFLGGYWPPYSYSTLHIWSIPFLNTLTLLLSGFLINTFFYTFTQLEELLFNIRQSYFKMVISKSYLLNFFSKLKLARYSLELTAILGFFFLILQAYEYSCLSFSFTDNYYTNIFFILTGLHGLHVLLGLIFILIALLRLNVRSTFLFLFPERSIGFITTVLYWHFVDVVWIFLFIFVYYYNTY